MEDHQKTSRNPREVDAYVVGSETEVQVCHKKHVHTDKDLRVKNIVVVSLT